LTWLADLRFLAKSSSAELLVEVPWLLRKWDLPGVREPIQQGAEYRPSFGVGLKLMSVIAKERELDVDLRQRRIELNGGRSSRRPGHAVNEGIKLHNVLLTRQQKVLQHRAELPLFPYELVVRTGLPNNSEPVPGVHLGERRGQRLSRQRRGVGHQTGV
jgi:hypothetical protein